jgi:hypothetical protein
MPHFPASSDAVIWDKERLMEERIIVELLEVEDELANIGMPREFLLEALAQGERERALCTANDPIGFASLVVYAKITRRLRELALPTGEWIKDDSNMQATIKNPKTKARVQVCNFDEFAGNKLVRPTNRSPKGEISRKNVMCNMTGWLPGLPDPAGEVLVEDGYQHWVFGVYIDDTRPTGAELSRPILFDGSHYKKFAPRIILVDGTGDELTPNRQGDSDGQVEVVEIPISKK